MSFQGIAPIRFGSVSMTTTSLGTKDPEVGTVIDEGNERYVFVYNGGNSVIAPGKGATVSGVSGYTVTVSSVGASVGNDVFVGVCKHATIATAAYGWLCTRGFVPIQASAAIAISPGNMVLPGTDGFFTNVVHSGATQTAAKVVGKCVASAASAATIGMAYINV